LSTQTQRTEPIRDSGDRDMSGAPAQKFKPAQLEKALVQQCSGRLSDMRWFYTDWQHGGSLTGYAVYHDKRDYDVFVKVPVPENEMVWARRLQDAGDVVAHLFEHGHTLGEHKLGWVIMERLPYGPLGSAWAGKEFDLLIEAVGRFYLAASAFEIESEVEVRDWVGELDSARKSVRRYDLADGSRWNKALKAAQKKVKSWAKMWNQRCVDHYCHGDMHLGNAMTRYPAPQGPAVLIDLALVHRGHWIEDAVYFEQQYWGHEGAVDGRKLARQLAHQRKSLGLSMDKKWSQLADVYRALLAMSAPLSSQTRNDSAHMQTALTVLEHSVG